MASSKLQSALVAFLVVLLAVHSQAKRRDAQQNHVVQLADGNFTEALNSCRLLVLEFSATWCKHCADLEPHYRKAAHRVFRLEPPLATTFAWVNAPDNKELTERYAITSFPTILIIHTAHPDHPVRYFGASKEMEIVDEVMKHASSVAWKPPRAAVRVLKESNFARAVGKAEIMLVAFLAPWCDHCKRFKPTLERAAQLAKKKLDKPIPMARVDCEAERALCDEYDIEQFPTLKVFREGRVSEYNGKQQTEVEIVNHLAHLREPPSVFIQTVGEMQAHLELYVDTPVIVGFFEDTDAIWELPTEGVQPPADVLRLAFFNTADEQRMQYSFVHCPYHLAQMLDIDIHDSPDAAVVLLRELPLRSEFEPWYHVFSSNDVMEVEVTDATNLAMLDLLSFIEQHRIGVLGNMHAGNGGWFKDTRPLVVVYHEIDYSLDGQRKKINDKYPLAYTRSVFWRNKVLPVANEFRHHGITFTMANSSQYARHVVELGLRDVEADLRVGLWSNKDDEKFRMVDESDPAFTDFSADALRDFVSGYVQGTLEPYRHSEPVPYSQEGPVVKVVANSYAEVVDGALAAGKDVLIEFYAPWCSHCKKLAPVYEKVAKALRKEKHLVVAKMDAESNDVPKKFDLPGYPAVFLLPASGDNILEFEGDRDFDSIMAFLKRSTSKPLQHFKKSKRRRKSKKKKTRKKKKQQKKKSTARQDEL